MRLHEQILQLLQEIQMHARKNLSKLEEGTESVSFMQEIAGLSQLIHNLNTIVPETIYLDYQEFFDAFCSFCEQCASPGFMEAQVDQMASSLSLLIECLQDMEARYARSIKICVCCGQKVPHLPEYSCPFCGASDRDRMLISFLKKERLRDAAEGTKVLQVAPTESISRWILRNCPQILYETTDLSREGVTFLSDLQDMRTVGDGTYDVIICSQVPEHALEEGKALSEIRRVLKPDGKLIFLHPINLNRENVEARAQFHIHSLGKEYFGPEIFAQCALTETGVLYVLTKKEEVSLDLAEKITVDKELCQNGPLVSVIMSCYNHESFVAEAIESVLNQSYKNIEFIVADDASSDQTATVMKRYSVHFAKEMYFDKNIGGRSEFLQQYATGKYIALMHSDDVWDKDKLALQVAYMEDHAACGVCLTWAVYTDEELREKGDTIFLQKNRSSSEWMHFFWKYSNALCNPSSLIRRETGMAVRKTPCSQLPDLFKWIDVVQCTSIYIIPKVLVRMRRYAGNGRENTSNCSRENKIRHEAEEGCNWLWVIRDMRADFFKQAFGSMMINPLADTAEEIKCEKYFLMLRHRNLFVQYSAMCYLCEIFDEVRECLEEKYHYLYREFREDIMKKGIAAVYDLQG